MTPQSRKLLAPTLSLGLLAAACKFDPTGTTWFWTDQPIVAVVLGLAATGFSVALLRSLRKSTPQHPR